MITKSCATLTVLLLLVSSSFSQNMDDNSKTLDAAVDDPARTNAPHRPPGGVGARLRRWNSIPEDSVELQDATSIEDEERIDEKGLEGANATHDIKDSKRGYGFYNPYLPQNLFTVAPTTSPYGDVCRLLAANYGITAPNALTYLQQCVGLLGLISGPTTTVAPAVSPPVSSICQLLAANAGITAPATLQTYLQQCTSLLGLITGPTTAAPTTTVAPTITPPVSSTCQLLAANAGITAPAALQTYLQQCAVLLGLITAPTTTAAPTTTVAPTITPPVTSTCQLLAANAGITAPAALQTYLQQCAVLLGLFSG